MLRWFLLPKERSKDVGKNLADKLAAVQSGRGWGLPMTREDAPVPSRDM